MPRVEAVRLAGVEALDPRFVREVIVTRESRCRSPLLAPVCALTEARWEEETAGFVFPLPLRRGSSVRNGPAKAAGRSM